MADISGFSGAVTLPAAHGGAAAGFTIRRSYTQKNVGRFASGSKASKTRLGTYTIGGDIRVFLQTNATPGFVSAVADGSALTLTMATGCTLSGTAVFPELNVNEEFDDPAVEGIHGYQFTGDVT